MDEIDKFLNEIEGYPPAVRRSILKKILLQDQHIDIKGLCNNYDYWPCSYWDGIDNRCPCGNNRICWTWDDESEPYPTNY